ncbi:MAG: hypothetical protein ABIQ81_00600 [Novosphingobium sp.]
MTEPHPTPRPDPRIPSGYHWTNPKIGAFLRALAAGGSITDAARSVGMSRQSAYALRRRLDAAHRPAFGQLWDKAVAIGHDAPRAPLPAAPARPVRPASWHPSWPTR